MSILINVYYSLLVDIEELTGVHLDFPDDLTMSWVLIEAPALDKNVQQYLEHGTHVPDFPDWLRPLWDAFINTVFDEGDLVPLCKKRARLLQCLRTILVFGYKAEFEPSYEQLQNAVTAFEDANQGVAIWERSFKMERVPGPTFREARRLVGYVIGRANWSEVIPNHGPGAVFPPHSPCNKGNFDICTPINEYYPYDKNFCCLDPHGTGFAELRSRDWDSYDSIVAKLVAVPKDSRGPRLICVHPKEAIWIQQGQRHVLEDAITKNHLTSLRINFDDQSINGSLALRASFSREFITLDLKEASDRISKSLVEYLFGTYAYGYLSCSRASHVKLLDGRLLELHMFAPMGNALTFPVEALVFWSLARAGILSRYGHNCDDVYVFGDDIIVPSEYYEGAIGGLISAGLIPNMNKTFRKGFFRESCGVDAYSGEDVTPFRCKVRGINSYSDAESLCDLAKRLRISGFSNTSSFLYSCINRRLSVVARKSYPRLSMTNNPDCQGLMEYVDCDSEHLIRNEPRVTWCYKTHCWKVPYRKRARTSEVLKTHAWWHVQDSLLNLVRKDKGIVVKSFFDPEWVEGNMAIESERGLRDRKSVV